jgi:hypothetical protein
MNRGLLLARTFFGRFFESELMPAGVPQVQLLIWSIALLASPGLLLPMRFAAKYSSLQLTNPSALPGVLLMDRLLFITLTMTALGLVTLVIWEGVYPDRRDARILSVLPVPGRVQIAARVAALTAVALIFTAGINLVPTLTFGPTVGAFGGASGLVRGAAAHAVTTGLAGLFVFFSLIALQGVLLIMLGRHWAERVSVALQMAFVVMLMQLLFFMPQIAGMLRANLGSAATDPILRLVPSVWFLGLYDIAGGRPSGGTTGLAVTAIAASAVAAGGALGFVAATHARLTKMALETRDRSGGMSAFVRNTVGRMIPVIAPAPIERATIGFTVRTLARSRQHRMLLALYIGVAGALVVAAIVPLALRDGGSLLARPGVAVLSAPLVLMFFALTGMRALFAIPVEPGARWSVRLAEPQDLKAAMRGVRKAMLVLGVLPAVALAVASAAVLWGKITALVHGVMCVLLGILLTEILAVGLCKVPFTCTYLPGRSRIRTLWPFYLTGFTTYTYSMASLELRVLDSPPRLLAVAGAICVAIGLAAVARARFLRELPGLRFEEEDPTAIFEGFHLSEGLAASAPARAD